MPQVVQKKSYASVTVFWLDREAAVDAVRVAAGDLIRADPNVSKVVLFGSLASGTATATSDADVLVILRKSDLRLLDRAGHYGDYFCNVGLPVELFVYTEDEVRQHVSSIADHALAKGIELE